MTFFARLMILLLLSCQCAAAADCLPEQRSILLQLKKNLSVPSAMLLSWQPGSNCCLWDGVSCDTTLGHVTGLDLGGHNLSGNISPSLFELTSLQTLSFANNRFDALKIPVGFEKLEYLTRLNLSNAGFAGDIPTTMFQLKELRVLDLSDNPSLSRTLPDFPAYSKLEKLILSRTNLSGGLPESIQNVKSLIELDVSSCQLSGVIPNVRFMNLTNLDLSNNSLSGQIHASLLTLPALSTLRLGYNRFSDQLPEFASGTLTVLDVTSNSLDGPIPKSLFAVSELIFLGLASNSFTDTLQLDMFSSLTNLVHLDLSNNKLSVQDGNGSLVFPKLTALKLASCNLVSVPRMLQYHDGITILDLSNNSISGSIPKWIWGVNNHTVTYLNISYNSFTQLTGKMPEYLTVSDTSPTVIDLRANALRGPFPLPPRNTNLLDYSDNNFSSSIPSNISLYLASTTFLSLRNNSLTGEIPYSICKSERLQVLDLSYNILSGPIPRCLLQNSTELIVLSLRSNQLTGNIPTNVTEKCVLRTFNLNTNHLVGRIPDSIISCTSLEVIDVGNNNLTDVFPFATGVIFSLRILVLRSNNFYGTIAPPPIYIHNNFTFNKLQILDLSSNRFSGELPSRCFENLYAMMLKSPPSGNIVEHYVYPQQLYQDTVVVTMKGRDTTYAKILTVLKAIDFSNNAFSGEIPEDLGGLRALIVLNLSCNAFTGVIPRTFGNLAQLESLDLSANQLVGPVPEELTKLTFLSFLNVSSNGLVGEIPLGNQMSTFGNASFGSNQGLCGPPLTRRCSEGGADVAGKGEEEDSVWTVEMALTIGIGYGVGVGVVLVFQSVSCPIRTVGEQMPPGRFRWLTRERVVSDTNGSVGKIPFGNLMSSLDSSSFGSNALLRGPPPDK